MQIDRIEETTDSQGRPECFVSGKVEDTVTGEVHPFAKWLSPGEYVEYQAGTSLSQILRLFIKQHLTTMRKESGQDVQILRAELEKVASTRLSPVVDTEYQLRGETGVVYAVTVLANQSFVIPEGHSLISEFPTGVL